MKNLKTLILGAILMLLIVIAYDYYKSYRSEKESLIAQTALIEREINQVRKLIVTEASYAKIYNYQNTKSYGWDYFTSQKKALISSNTSVQIVYDLKELGYKIDAESKTIKVGYSSNLYSKVSCSLSNSASRILHLVLKTCLLSWQVVVLVTNFF